MPTSAPLFVVLDLVRRLHWRTASHERQILSHIVSTAYEIHFSKGGYPFNPDLANFMTSRLQRIVNGRFLVCRR